MIRVQLPWHLQSLAQADPEIELEPGIDEPVVSAMALARALEARYPALRGAILDPGSGARRPLLRFFACQTDLSHDEAERELPEAVLHGREPLIVVGAIAGG